VLRDGRFTAKKLERQPPPQPKQKEEFGYWAAMEKTQGQRYEAEAPTVPPRSTSRPQAAAPAVTLEVLPRVGWFLLLFVLMAINLLHIPMIQVLWNQKDVTLPGIGTLRAKPELEQDDLAAITTGYVTETQKLISTKNSPRYQVRYRFQIGDQWYTSSEGITGEDMFVDIDSDVWEQLDPIVKSGGQATLEVRYLREDPWDNRPVESNKRVHNGWLFVWIFIGFLSLVSLEQAGHAYVNYGKAQKAAKQGKTGKMKYWEIKKA
jgi:hypothetical protein